MSAGACQFIVSCSGTEVRELHENIEQRELESCYLAELDTLTRKPQSFSTDVSILPNSYLATLHFVNIIQERTRLQSVSCNVISVHGISAYI